MFFRCTGKQCKSSNISVIPPAVTGAKVKSKFAFKYGRVEIRAQLPRGDWIYPRKYTLIIIL